MLVIILMMAVVDVGVEGKFRTAESWSGVPTWEAPHKQLVTDTTITVAWKVPKNTGFTWTADLTYCPSILANIQADFQLANYPIGLTKAQFEDRLVNTASFWDTCVTVSGLAPTIRSYKVSSLTAATNYKFTITLNGKRADSATVLSVSTATPLLMTTSLDSTATLPQFVDLFTRGTGLHNHAKAQIKLHDGTTETVILDHQNYRGLCFAVLRRTNLELVEIGMYDTMLDLAQFNAANLASRSGFPYYTMEVSWDDNGGRSQAHTTTFVTKQTINYFAKSDELVARIKLYNHEYIIVLVSCNSWERYFSSSLAGKLLQYGAFNIQEFAHHYEPQYSDYARIRRVEDNSPIDKTNLYHPFAFIGIHNLAPGQAFERLRSNKGFYLGTGAVPHADLRVKLRLNPMTQLYTVDQDQYMNREHFWDNFTNTFEADDRSLMAQIGYLATINLTNYNNMNLGIELGATGEITATTNDNLYTEADRVVTDSTLKTLKRHNPDGTLLQYRANSVSNLVPVGVQYLSDLGWYSWFISYLMADEPLECGPPYTQVDGDPWYNKACRNTADTTAFPVVPIILQCRIGLVPQLCPGDAADVQNTFTGYT